MSDSDNYKFHKVGDDPARVVCAHCGELIVAASTRCEYCGVHFEGTAADFAPYSQEHVESDLNGYTPSKRDPNAEPHPIVRRVAMVILIVFGVMIVVLLFAGIWNAFAGWL
ncbi:MAG: hypothetical protein WD768_07025 [Phycisphaeraceae bacterium]